MRRAVRPKEAVRHDPPTRAVDRVSEMATVHNKAPGYYYVLVNKGDPHTVAKYREMRYTPERWRFKRGRQTSEYPDGVERDSWGLPVALNAFAGTVPTNAREGQMVEYMENYVMRIPLAEFQRIQQHGAPWADGKQGQEGADHVMKLMRDPKQYAGLADGIGRNQARVRPASFDGHQHGETWKEQGYS
jgi:hypothetical protein